MEKQQPGRALGPRPAAALPARLPVCPRQIWGAPTRPALPPSALSLSVLDTWTPAPVIQRPLGASPQAAGGAPGAETPGASRLRGPRVPGRSLGGPRAAPPASLAVSGCSWAGGPVTRISALVGRWPSSPHVSCHEDTSPTALGTPAPAPMSLSGGSAGSWRLRVPLPAGGQWGQTAEAPAGSCEGTGTSPPHISHGTGPPGQRAFPLTWMSASGGGGGGRVLGDLENWPWSSPSRRCVCRAHGARRGSPLGPLSPPPPPGRDARRASGHLLLCN